MKLAFPYLVFITILLTSCSKHKNFSDFEENKENTASKTTLISSDVHNAIEAELFETINNHRSSIGLTEMEFESSSYYYASLHTEYMIEKGVTSHAKFEERAANIANRTGAIFVAENVARNYETIQEAFEAWLESSGHRKNIEGDYYFSAISIKPNNNGDLYFTQVFYR